MKLVLKSEALKRGRTEVGSLKTEKTIASILKGENVSDAVKKNISVSVGINIPF